MPASGLRSRLIVAALLLIGCGRSGPRTPTTVSALERGRRAVIEAPSTSIQLTGAALMPNGHVAALVCVTGPGGVLPAGGSIALLGREGNVVGKAPVAFACSARLVRAGSEVIVVSTGDARSRMMEWKRFDPSLREVGAGSTPITGPITAIAGRDDGAFIVAAQADSYDKDPRIEVSLLDRGSNVLARWQLRGRDVSVSNVRADGDAVLVVGIQEGSASIDGGAPFTATDESLLVMRLAATGSWTRTIGANGVSIVSYERPSVVRTRGGIVVTWLATSVGNRLPAPDYAALGGMPPSGSHRLYALLDATGTVTAGRIEPADHDGAPRELQVLPDGVLLEHRIRQDDAYEIGRCKDTHGCTNDGGPEAYAHVHALVVVRRDAATLAPLATATLGGTMVLGGTHVELEPATGAVVAVGDFAGIIDLPDGDVASPVSRRRDETECSSAVNGVMSGDLFASPPEPDRDPCELRVTRHSALFVIDLKL